MEEVVSKALFWVLPLVVWAFAELLSAAVKSINGLTPFLQKLGIFVGCIILFPMTAILTGIWAGIIFEVLL